MRSRRAAAALVAVVAFVFAGCGGGEPARTTGPVTWVALSDIHFDPFAGADGPLVNKLAAAQPAQWAAILGKAGGRPSEYGEDTDYQLLASMLRSVSEVRQPQVAIVTGDFLAHEFEEKYDSYANDTSKAAYEAFVDKTVAFLALELGAALPQTQFVFTLGNSDSYCGDYELEPGGAFLAHTAHSWKPLVARGAGAPSFGTEFPELGSFVARMPIAEGRFFALNDVYWSRRYQNACGSSADEPAREEMAWLESAVESAPANHPLWLLMHIPPGIDVYATTQANEPVPLFTADFERRLNAVLSDRSWAAGVAGHLHMSTWRLLPPGSSSKATPVLGVPSISPVFANNPAYLTLQVNPQDASIVDYTAYVLDLSAAKGEWRREYSFADAYGTHGFDAAALGQLQGQLRDDPATRAKWEQYYNSGSGRGGIDETNYRDFLCGNVALTSAQYGVCRSPVAAG